MVVQLTFYFEVHCLDQYIKRTPRRTHNPHLSQVQSERERTLVQNSSRYFSLLKRVYRTQTLTSTEHQISSLHSHFWDVWSIYKYQWKSAYIHIYFSMRSELTNRLDSLKYKKKIYIHVYLYLCLENRNCPRNAPGIHTCPTTQTRMNNS